MRGSSLYMPRPLLVAVMSLAANSLAAQLPNASAAAFGMAGNFTAMARGYEGVASNPANLAMPDRPRFSLGIGIAGGSAALEPIDAKTLHRFSGRVVDSVTRVSWIDRARLAGGQSLNFDGVLTPIAVSVGPVALQIGSAAYSTMRLSPDAWEAFLFGNAGLNNGQPKALDLSGTRVRIGAFTTGGLSFALPVPFRLTRGMFADERAALGITAKYVVGHTLIVAQDVGSVVGANEILFNFPAITSTDGQDGFDGRAGSGAAADVALAWSGGRWKLGVLAENVINSFRWDTTRLSFRPGTGTFDGSDNTTDFDERPYGSAPQVLRDLVESQAFKPAVAIGMAFKPLARLTLTADMKRHTGGEEAIVIGPKSRIGVGAEWRIIPMVPLRAGLASVTDGWLAGVGAGLSIRGYELGASTSIRRRGQAMESGVMIGVVGIGR